MEKGDILTLAGGVLLVLIIAVVTNPNYITGLSPGVATPVTTTITYPVLTPVLTPVVPVTPTVSRTPTPVPTIAPPYRITYNNSPFSYPRFKMPDNVATFGAGDIPLRGREIVTFAYVDEIKGGLTQKFTVPFPVWIINTTVIANRTPQYGNFKMVLCYGNNGTVIDGEEILNRGTMYRVIETSGTEVYMIVTTAYIDSYHISLETPRDYYDVYNKR